MNTLTPKEQMIFDFIKTTLRENGYSPSIRDIRTALNIKSTSTVHTYLERLERKGYIHKRTEKAAPCASTTTTRSIRKWHPCACRS